MEKSVKHRFLNSVLFTALFVPLGFFLLRDTIIAITGIMFESIGGKESFLYQINEDIARLIIAGLLILIMPLFFRGKCNFGFKGGKLALGICLALPELIVPVWNLLQIKVYEAPLVTGAAAVAAAIMHGIGPGVSEEVFCRGFCVFGRISRTGSFAVCWFPGFLSVFYTHSMQSPQAMFLRR